jgi:hypothetical protein
MSSRIISLIAAIVFLVLALGSLYRLIVGFPVTIGGMMVGQVATFFAFVICAALALMLFRAARGDVIR